MASNDFIQLEDEMRNCTKAKINDDYFKLWVMQSYLLVFNQFSLKVFQIVFLFVVHL